MTGDAPRGAWIEGRLIESDAEIGPGPGESARGFGWSGWSGWSWVLGVLALVVVIDLALGMLPPATSREPSRAELRERIAAAARAPGRSILVVGDRGLDAATLAGQLEREGGVEVHAIDLARVTPSDALALLAELDRVDPEAAVELALIVDLRDLDPRLESSGAARPELAELAADEPWASLALAHDLIRERAPIVRHRATLGLAEPPTSHAHDRADGQLEALAALIDRLHLRGRKATLVLPPRFDPARAHELELGRRQAELARALHDRGPSLALVDLDHPLFVAEHFDEQGRLRDEGRELLAINVLHELAAPLARRPFEWQMVHVEGHDQTLVHRVDPGFAEAGATSSRFAAPEGVAVDREGTRIVIADTGNHMLRQLRGNFQTVERLVGDPREPGIVDGPREHARVEQPRRPEIAGERVYFIDGEAREHLRVVEPDAFVRTLAWTGPRCLGMQALRVRETAAGREIWVACADGQLLRIDEHAGAAEQLSRGQVYVALELHDDHLWLADTDARIWERRVRADGSLSRPKLMFANTARVIGGDASDLLPHGHRVGFPYRFDEVALAKVLDMRFVARYGSLLVADEHPVTASVEPPPSERVHLRVLDLDEELVLPWIKAQAHGEANTLWNEQAQLNASWYHFGSMALVERDASLVWLEHDRSRLVRIADGMLGLAQTANHHTRGVSIPHFTTIAGETSRKANLQRPDRFLDRRWAPLEREGPYVMLLLGSSLSSMSDRFANYSLARRIERELERELGYRDQIAIELYAISTGAAGFADNVRNLENWLQTYVPPDVVWIEAHDFAGNWLRKLPEPAQLAEQFAKLEALAARYDTLVIFYDNCQTEANRRDGLRSSDPEVIAALEQARALGFTVLRPGDLLLDRLLLDAPWGNQPYANNQHHGASWAIDRNAELIAQLGYPALRRFLRGRTPARLRERDPLEFELEPDTRPEPLRSAMVGVEIERAKLPKVAASHLQREYGSGRLRVHVDLAGYPELARDDEAALERLGLAVALEVLDDEVYAELARELDIEIVEFTNYDEYGEGVVDSARPRWRRSFDAERLEAFLAQHAEK